jgi:hypothetical protein
MFKSRLLPIGMCCAGFLCVTAGVSAQDDFHAFWAKFKTAVASNDKAAVAGMTNFPLSMPYGVETVKSKAEFLDEYDGILNMEADAKRCFQATEPEKYGARYGIYCAFKQEPESSDDRPIEYVFEETKAGWRFTGLDNTNE